MTGARYFLINCCRISFETSARVIRNLPIYYLIILENVSIPLILWHFVIYFLIDCRGNGFICSLMQLQLPKDGSRGVRLGPGVGRKEKRKMRRKEKKKKNEKGEENYKKLRYYRRVGRALWRERKGYKELSKHALFPRTSKNVLEVAPWTPPITSFLPMKTR